MHTSEQANFWKGEFGKAYTEYNEDPETQAANRVMFARILEKCETPQSVLEIGANRGFNLWAIRSLLPDIALAAVEVNSEAVELLQQGGCSNVWQGDIFEFKSPQTFDLVLSKCVLSHLSPDALPHIYDTLYQSSRRYICVAEYYNSVPLEITFHEPDGRLWKRDFAGEMLERFPNLHLIDQGTISHNAPQLPQGDLSWFLMERLDVRDTPDMT